MIQTEKEYERARKQVEENDRYFAAERIKLAKEGWTPEQIQNYLDPSIAMIEDTRDEVKWYESARKGNFMTISNSTGLGRALVALRISRDMTQAELANKLDVVQSQVSRDEENEYHGVSMDRIYRILAIFEVQLEGRIVKASSPGKEPTHGRQAA